MVFENAFVRTGPNRRRRRAAMASSRLSLMGRRAICRVLRVRFANRHRACRYRRVRTQRGEVEAHMLPRRVSLVGPRNRAHLRGRAHAQRGRRADSGNRVAPVRQTSASRLREQNNATPRAARAGKQFVQIHGKKVATAACYALRGLRTPPPESDRQRSHRRAGASPADRRHRPTPACGPQAPPLHDEARAAIATSTSKRRFSSVIRRTRVRSGFLILATSPSPERASPPQQQSLSPPLTTQDASSRASGVAQPGFYLEPQSAA